MIKVGFFDTKPYDREWFDKMNDGTFDIEYFESKLNARTARITGGLEAVVAFVNDTLDKETIETLYDNGVKLIAMRCAGYNNVDFKAAYKKLNIVRVPGYSPHAVAEHAMALLLTLNRKIHRAYNRTKEHNFSLNGLTGFVLRGKTAGVIGTGRIGQAFIDICKGFGMKVLAYDVYPNDNLDVEYVSLDTLLEKSDIISLHCPLTKETEYIINDKNIRKMKKNAIIINTSRGALVDSDALLLALRHERLGGAALDVYEEESNLFFEDHSNAVLRDKTLPLLISLPNVIVTSHQAFLTEEALESIAKVTIDNMKAFFEGQPLENEICYYCMDGKKKEECKSNKTGRCF